MSLCLTAKKLFEKLNNIAKKVVDGAGQIMGNVSESQANKEAENNGAVALSPNKSKTGRP